MSHIEQKKMVERCEKKMDMKEKIMAGHPKRQKTLLLVTMFFCSKMTLTMQQHKLKGLSFNFQP